MAAGKIDLGKAVPASERNLVDRISNAINEAGSRAARGEESAIEDQAALEGAALLFNEKREGCISALAIMLIPKEEKQKRRVAAVAQPFGFVAQLSKKQKIAVLTPKGYVTDFASIPSFGHWFISPFGKHAEAAVVHDWLYTLGKPGDRKGRRLADKTFKRALKVVGVGPFRRNVMYWFVRFGGAGGYGLKSDFCFRGIPDLNPTDPLPDRAPFMTTICAIQIAKTKKVKAKAVAVETT